MPENMDSTLPRYSDDLDAAFEHSPALGQFIVDRFLVNELLRLARQTDGDFDSLMILAVLELQVTAADLAASGATLPRTIADSALPDAAIKANGLRSSDLAQITGIPRETVRRKLERMQSKGRVQRHDNGRWHAVAATTSQRRQAARETAGSICQTADELCTLAQR